MTSGTALRCAEFGVQLEYSIESVYPIGTASLKDLEEVPELQLFIGSKLGHAEDFCFEFGLVVETGPRAVGAGSKNDDF